MFEHFGLLVIGNHYKAYERRRFHKRRIKNLFQQPARFGVTDEFKIFWLESANAVDRYN